jgi:two-component system chemotaxis response regulator CheY
VSEPKTLLIVDDSRVSRMMIKRFPGGAAEEFRFIEAASGEEALQQVEGADIDLMTIDLNMPGMDGLTLAGKLKGQFPDASITLLTANIQEATQRKATEIGIDFLPKPITAAKNIKFRNVHLGARHAGAE